MKFLESDVKALKSILEVTDLVDIEQIAIVDGKVHGINKDNTALIISDFNVPQLGEVKLGISRLREFRKRLELFTSEFSIETKDTPKHDVSAIEMKSSKASLSYRATGVNTIKYPKDIDDEIVKTVSITKEEALLILSAGKAMGAENISFTFKKKGVVVVEFADVVQDSFNLTLENPFEEIAEGDSNVSIFVFPVFADLLRVNLSEFEAVSIRIGNSSALIAVNGYDIRLISQTE